MGTVGGAESRTRREQFDVVGTAIRRSDRISLLPCEQAGTAKYFSKPPDSPALRRYAGTVDAITRDIILKLTTRIADLEAAVEVDRALLKEMAQEHALANGKSFDAATFDLQRAEAFDQQRAKMAVGVEEKEAAPVAPFVLDLPVVEPL